MIPEVCVVYGCLNGSVWVAGVGPAESRFLSGSGVSRSREVVLEWSAKVADGRGGCSLRI
jgi:hypothetical protein